MSHPPRGKIHFQTAFREAGMVCLRLSGVIDEHFDAHALFQDAATITILDLEGVKRISSFGVRQWTEAMKSLPASVHHLYLLRCPACIIDQLNMVLHFGGRAEVLSALAIYYCTRCQEERVLPVDVLGDRLALLAGTSTAAACPGCSGPLQLEEDPHQYFRFVVPLGAQAIEPRAAAQLEAQGLYGARAATASPEEGALAAPPHEGAPRATAPTTATRGDAAAGEGEAATGSEPGPISRPLEPSLPEADRAHTAVSARPPDPMRRWWVVAAILIALALVGLLVKLG